MKIDARLVPNQEVRKQVGLVRAHLDKHGFGDLDVRMMGGGDEWSQTSVKAPVVQAALAMYKQHGIEPMVWPRSAGSSPAVGIHAQARPARRRRRRWDTGHARTPTTNTSSSKATTRSPGSSGSEQSMVELIYAFANAPNGERATA